MSNINIEPFPADVLAKLVLGYLHDEGLTTTYDTFLSSTHLKDDNHRIFMASLKDILSEYRAVKMYLETCRPELRRRIFRCSNLLEAVMFLVQNVDEGKLQALGDSRESSQNTNAVTLKTTFCPKIQKCESIVTEDIIELDNIEDDRPQEKDIKRRCSFPSNKPSRSSKRAYPDRIRYLDSIKIQNMVIDNVLSKLHGP